MRNTEKIGQSLQNLGNALERLKEGLNIDISAPLVIDAITQRFEFTFDLFSRTLKRILELESEFASTPKDALKSAFKLGWLNNEGLWLHMLQDKIEILHLYERTKTQQIQIYQNIKNYFPILEKTFLFSKNRSLKQ